MEFVYWPENVTYIYWVCQYLHFIILMRNVMFEAWQACFVFGWKGCNCNCFLGFLCRVWYFYDLLCFMFQNINNFILKNFVFYYVDILFWNRILRYFFMLFLVLIIKFRSDISVILQFALIKYHLIPQWLGFSVDRLNLYQFYCHLWFLTFNQGLFLGLNLFELRMIDEFFLNRNFHFSNFSLFLMIIF